MWKKPSIEKPDFKKVNLEEMSGQESLETNGGVIGIAGTVNVPVFIPAPPLTIFYPPRLSGIIARPYDILIK